MCDEDGCYAMLWTPATVSLHARSQAQGRHGWAADGVRDYCPLHKTATARALLKLAEKVPADASET